MVTSRQAALRRGVSRVSAGQSPRCGGTCDESEGLEAKEEAGRSPESRKQTRSCAASPGDPPTPSQGLGVQGGQSSPGTREAFGVLGRGTFICRTTRSSEKAPQF